MNEQVESATKETQGKADPRNDQHVAGPKELVYNAHIKPLLEQIMKAADENGISFASVCILDDHEGKGKLRTSCIHGEFRSIDSLAFRMLDMLPD